MIEMQGVVLPQPSSLTQPFWDGCRDGKLLVQQCGDCAAKFFTPLPACPRCLSRKWSWAVSPGIGTLYSFTIVHRPARPERSVPYVIGTIDLDDGWSMTSNVLEFDPDTLRCGQRVRVRFVRMSEDFQLPMFTVSD